MERHSLLSSTSERRFSLNSTHMASPIAESTCLSNNASASKWFGKMSPKISPNRRSNSSICLSTSRSTPTRDQSNTSCMSSTRQKLNLSRIDPRVYADANSSGLVSRVMKYQEGNRQMKRSMSVNNLYNKPGQFPVVHLKKKELTYKASQHSISMTRIAPPGRTFYYGNTLSSLLSSNSIVGVHKTDEELSCENRPILHPPPTENEMAPTRSVLEVLKEISRKRINTSDLQPDEESKKSCNREFVDFVDSPHPSTSAMTNINNGISYKRQRDLVNQQQTMLPYVHMNATEVNQQTQKSPEQSAKRRHCNYNNDITSSLSSSIIHSNKRKLFEQNSSVHQGHNKTLGHIDTNGSNNSSPESEIQAAKIQRRQNDLRFQNLPKTTVWSTPVTPLPSTPYSQPSQNSRLFCEKEEKIPEAPPQRSASAPEAASVQKLTSTQVPSAKPKLTLFNKNYNERNDHQSCFGNGDLDSNECTGINFVKPKKLELISSGSNPLIERTQKSKLALMLSGLRGEIYQDNELEDELDGKGNKKSANAFALEKQSSYVISKDKSPTVTLNEKPTILSVETVKQASQPEPSKTTTTVMTLSTSGTTTTTAATTANTQTSTTKLVFTPPKSSAAQTITLSNAAPTFSFGTAHTPSTLTSSTASTTSSVLTTSAVVATSTASLETTTKPMFSFGNTATLASTTTASATIATSTLTTTPSAVTQVAKPVEFGGATAKTAGPASETSNTTACTLNVGKSSAFTFGSMTKPTATVVAPAAAESTSTTTTLVATAPTFGNASLTSGTLNFGDVGKTTTNTISMPFSSSINQADTSSKSFSFGVSNDATALLPTTTPSNSNAPVKFSFGNATSNSILNASTTTTTNSTSTFSPAVTATPSFGSAQNANLLFGGGTSTNANTESAKLFSFGGGSANTSSTTTATTTATVATTTTSQNLFSFASASSQANKPPTAPIGGGFSFSGGVPSNANTNTASTTSTFGVQPTNTSIFPFGGATQGVNAATTTVPVTPTAKTTATNIFGFNQKPATTSASFAFGGNNANTTANNQVKSNPNTTTTGNAFTFGGGASTASNNSKNELTSNSSANIFSFGGGGGQSNNIAPNTEANTKTNSIFGGNASSSTQLTVGVNKPTAAPSFNFSAGNTPQKAFGSGAIGATTSLNGNNQGSNATTAAAFSFVDQSKKPTAAVGGFSFGSVANTSSNTSTITNPVAPNTGVVKPNFSFGSSVVNTNNNNNTASNGSSSTSFGTLATAASNNTFTFGSSTNANAGTSAAVSGGNIFGNNASSSKPVTSTGGFSFSAKTNVPTANGQASNATITPFAFGGSAAAAATETAKSFSFSGVASSNGPAATSGSSIFGSVQSTKPAAGTFNFGSATTNNLAMAAPTQNNNIFSIPSNGQQTDRPIRRATRRLQK